MTTPQQAAAAAAATANAGLNPDLGQARAEESSLSSWAGPYVTEMLGRGQALAETPYQAFTGPLTAGASNLQSTAFQGLGALQLPQASTGSFTGAGYTPLTAEQLAAGETPDYTSASDNMVQQYMNPYLEGALAPQYAQAQRDYQKAQRDLQSQYSQAGAYGGSRQGVAEGELRSGALQNLSQITGRGYEQAYADAQNMFNKDRTYGLQALDAQLGAGAEQRGITSEGIGADYAQFKEERDDPFKKVQYMQSLLQGLPLETQSYSYYQPSGLEALAGAFSGGQDIYSLLMSLGDKGAATPAAPAAPAGPDMGAYPNATYGNSPTSTATSAGDMGAYPGATYPNTSTVAPTPVTVPRPIAGITT